MSYHPVKHLKLLHWIIKTKLMRTLFFLRCEKTDRQVFFYTGSSIFTGFGLQIILGTILNTLQNQWFHRAEFNCEKSVMEEYSVQCRELWWNSSFREKPSFSSCTAVPASEVPVLLSSTVLCQLLQELCRVNEGWRAAKLNYRSLWDRITMYSYT
jgi:hypothetical protein